MCEEESDDQEAVAKLFEINDSIHRTIERYKLMKKGDVEAAAKIPQGTLGKSTGVGKNKDNELSLIDFNDGDIGPSTVVATSNTTDLLGSDEPPANSNQSQKPESLEDDLLGLSFQDKPYGQGGGIALGFGANTSKHPHSLTSIEVYMVCRNSRPVITVIHDTAKLCQSTDIYPKPPTSRPTSSSTSSKGTKLRRLCRIFQLQTRFTILDSCPHSLPAASSAAGSAIPTTVRSVRLSDLQHEPLTFAILHSATTCQVNV